ncbi:MAG: DUF3307 domain-containing protein [Clostridia bacterium]|nr:DUF3307 domain-containing protein [Clostridia bacterium]MDQ7791714.1 DUF3307 domain-containing protein [Clostridia bacterium]
MVRNKGLSMNIFCWLLVGHLVGDFLLQTRWMADRKANAWAPLLAHSLLYTTAIAVFGYIGGGLSWLVLLVVLISHVILDRRGLVRFWVRYVNKADDLLWMRIVIDQIWHILVLALITLI